MRSSKQWARGVFLAGVALSICGGALGVGTEDAARLQTIKQQRISRLEAMTVEQRVQFGTRVAAWDALPRSEREDRRSRYQGWMQLLESERIALRAVAQEVAAFPPERRQALRAQFDALDASQRRGWRLGTALGSDYEKLHPVLAYVSPSQRLPLLEALRALTPQQRADLAVLGQRTPPQEREALRTSLLAQAPAQRGAWISKRLIQ